MGHVSAPFGVQGWVKVKPYTESLDALARYPVWWVGKEGAFRQYAVEQADVHGNSLIVRLEDLADRNEAAKLKGLQVAVPRVQLPKAEADEYYWSDLIGLEVVNRQGDALGRVESLLGTGANDVLVVRGERERLIPFIDQVVLEVDLEKGRLLCDWDPDF